MTIIFLAAIILLVGCASTPVFDTSKVDSSVTPTLALEDSVDNLGKTALWGGTILATQNLKDLTQIEILAYPLDSSQRPNLNDKPLGRFIIRNQGFLDPLSYSQGQLISVLGEVGENQSATIGESAYVYPVINAHQLNLWPKKKSSTSSNFSFGIGLSL